MGQRTEQATPPSGANDHGRAYERLVARRDHRRRKQAGIYYTPPELAHALAAAVLPRAIARIRVDREASERAGHIVLAHPLRVLDPACGGGALLVAAADWLMQWHLAWYRRHNARHWARRPNGPLQRKGRTCQLTPRERARIITTHLHGRDIDPEATAIARRSLTSLALAAEADAAELGPDWHRQLAHHVRKGDGLALRGQWEIVLANPPYQSFSGRHRVSEPPAPPAPADRRPQGWRTGHGLFAEAAATRLATQAVGLVLPGQVGHLAGYQPLREALTREMGLVELRYWREGVFPEATTPILTLAAERHHTGPVRIVSQTSPPATTRPQPQPGQPWLAPRATSPSDAPITLATLWHRSISLGNRVADPGVHTGNCAKKLILDAAPSAGLTAPVLEGRDVARYRCTGPRRHLRLDYKPAPGEYFRIAPQSRYADAPFVIRQTAARPIAGPREGALYFRNSLLALHPGTGPADAKWWLGLLNSRLLNWVWNHVVAESHQRTFPQVKVHTLRQLPMRALDFDQPRDRELHDRMVALVERMLAAQRAHHAKRAGESDRAIDELVCHAYGLTRRQIARVERETADPLAAEPAPAV